MHIYVTTRDTPSRDMSSSRDKFKNLEMSANGNVVALTMNLTPEGFPDLNLIFKLQNESRDHSFCDF